MREIKFRAKHKKSGKWNYGSNSYKIYEDKTMSLELFFKQLFLDWKTLTQFTGFKDKNGREIYEGDIIHFKNSPKKGEVGFMGYDQVYFNETTAQWGYITWNNGFSPFFGYCTHGTTDSGGLAFCEKTNSKDIEIIGNIYENPKFLKRR